MIPVVALVGRSNVGKSTLFNRLTKTRDALVADFPGLTRDRQYGSAKFKDKEFIIIDTGGIEDHKYGLEAHIVEHALLAIKEADVVLFIVDARAGIMSVELDIANYLRNLRKKIFVVVNKSDDLDHNIATADFYSLGLGEIYAIAALHGRGVKQLIDNILTPFFPKKYMELNLNEKDKTSYADEQHAACLEARGNEKKSCFKLQDLPIRIAIVGCPNVGKSTLTNCILGEDRVLVYDFPGTTRDSIYIHMARDGREYILVDTAGVRKRNKVTGSVEKFSIIKTLQAIENANVVLLVIDARKGISDQDLSLLGLILNSGRSLVIAMNKCDGMSREDSMHLKDTLDLRLGFVDFARVHFISALRGSGVGQLFQSVLEAYTCATNRVSTSILTKIMHVAIEDHQPPLAHGRRIKLKYAHSGGYNPPIVVIHGNQVRYLSDSYKRYLMNYFRRALQIIGTPIRIQFNEGDNPFAGKRNLLSRTQIRKRKRLLRHLRAS